MGPAIQGYGEGTADHPSESLLEKKRTRPADRSLKFHIRFARGDRPSERDEILAPPPAFGSSRPQARRRAAAASSAPNLQGWSPCREQCVCPEFDSDQCGPGLKLLSCNCNGPF